MNPTNAPKYMHQNLESLPTKWYVNLINNIKTKEVDAEEEDKFNFENIKIKYFLIELIIRSSGSLVSFHFNRL